MAEQKAQTSIEILSEAVQRQYPDLKGQKLKTAVREILLAPDRRMIEIDEKRRLSAKDLRFITANILEKPAADINVQHANTIELINGGIDPVAEYFSWLSETTLILNHLNDGFVTKEDALEREKFLELTDQREADLMVCLGLYESSRSKEGMERVKFTRYKLQRLREMRTAIKFLTKSSADVETTRSEYDAAIPYYKYFKNLQKLPFGYDMPYEQKVQLGISHDNDEDLEEDYDHYTPIVNDMLDDLKRQDEWYNNFTKKEDENGNTQNSEQNAELTGR